MTSEKKNPLESLQAVEVVSLQQAAGMQVFGLKWSVASDLNYATLDEVLQQEVLDVTEIGEGGQVPNIKVTNRSNRMVFLLGGELLIGCKQDRVLNTSMMVPANYEMPIPVTCVEAGRWGYRSKKFRSGGSSSHSYLRMMMSMQSSAHYKARGVPGSDQRAVWAEVERKMGRMGSSSASGALHDVIQDFDRNLNKEMKNLIAPDSCNGVVFAINGRIVGADLFDKPATLSKFWSKLIKSYALDALEDSKENAERLEPGVVTTWLKSANSAKQEWFKSPGVGDDVRIAGEQLVGATLVIDEYPVHLELFNEGEKHVPR